MEPGDAADLGAHARVRVERHLEQAGHAVAQECECVVDVPAAPVGLVDHIRHRAQLDCGDPRERRGAQHAEALHRLDLARRPAADARARGDREDMRLGQRAARSHEQRRVGSDPLDARQHRRRVDHVAVDRLRAENESRRLDRLRTGDADVEDGRRRMVGEPARGCERRLDGPDPAAERLETVDEVELAFGRRDYQHAADGSRAGIRARGRWRA